LPHPSTLLPLSRWPPRSPLAHSGTLRRNLNRLQGFALRPSPFAPAFPLRTTGGRCPPEFHPP
jgi:hypothetical protein